MQRRIFLCNLGWRYRDHHVVERQQSVQMATSTAEASHAQIAVLLSDLTAQMDAIRRAFAAAHVPGVPDVVFIDDLARCMECSWARHHATGALHMPAEIVVQCGQMLNASLQLLLRVEQLQTDLGHRAKAD